MKVTWRGLPEQMCRATHLVPDDHPPLPGPLHFKHLNNRPIPIFHIPHDPLIDLQRIFARLLQEYLIRHRPNIRPALLLLILPYTTEPALPMPRWTQHRRLQLVDGWRRVHEPTPRHEITPQLLRRRLANRPTGPERLDPVTTLRARPVQEHLVNPRLASRARALGARHPGRRGVDERRP